ncbi:MAG: PaaI family thioesterase [Granulosicoccus sp.]
MSNKAPNRVDEKAARAHLDTILNDHAQAFETFFLARFLNLSFEYFPPDAVDAEKEVCRISFPMSDMLRNPQGSLHGGAMATVMDISMGHLVNKVAGPGATIEMKVQYMRPVSEGIVTCEGRFTRRGRSIAFMESRLSDENDKLAALATATWKMP